MTHPAWLQSHSIVKLAFALIAGAALAGWANQRLENRLLDADLTSQRQITASTSAKLAAAQVDRDKYRELVNAAHALHGDVLAGAIIHIPKRDTVIMHDTISTERLSDSTRVATIHDSTFAGVIDGMIVAPPFPAALSFNYRVTRPAFDPAVGFVQVGNRAVAVVTWQNEHYEITDPFWKAPLKEPRLRRSVEYDYDVVHGQSVLSGGLTYRLFWGLKAAATLSQPLVLGQAPGGKLGIRKEW